VIGLAVAMLSGAWPGAVRAQALPPGPPGRYLLLVETSEAMRPRAAAALRVVESLLASGMHGQFRTGDTLGVWTYNEDLQAGELPLQVWTAQNESLLASNVVAFLKTQRFEKAAQPSVAWPDVQELVRESERLTVIWITSGNEPSRGTPFDADINACFDTHGREQKARRMPFVIVLRSQQGAWCGVTLNLAPWPVLLPAFPPWTPRPKPDAGPPVARPTPKRAEVAPVEKPAPAASAAPPARAEPIVRPPLIIVGKKEEPPPKPAPPETALASPVAPAPGAGETKSSPGGPTTPAESAPASSPAEPATGSLSPLQTGSTTAAVVLPQQPTGLGKPGTPAETPVVGPSSGAAAKIEPETTAATSAQRAPAVATATPEAARKGPAWAWVAGGFWAAAAVVLWLHFRRGRARHRGSLITRSMDSTRHPPV
jgi:hypothetical protein